MKRLLPFLLIAALAGAGAAADRTIPTPGVGPFGAAVTPNGEHLFVPQFGSFNPYVIGTDVAVFSTATERLLGVVAADLNPEDVAFTRDGKFAFVSNSSAATVTVIDVATRTPIATVSVGAPFMTFAFGIGVTPDGTRCYVCTAGGNYDGSEENIVVLDADPSSNTFTRVVERITVTGGFSRPAFAGRRLAVPRGFPGNDFSAAPQLALFKTGRPIDRATRFEHTVELVPAPGGVHGIEDVAVDAAGRYAYAAAFNWMGNHDEVLVVDLRARTVADIVSLGSGDGAQHGIAISPDGLLVAVTNFTKNTVSWIFTPTNTVIRETPTGINPNEVAFTPDGRKAYVTNQGGGSVSVFDLSDSAGLLARLVRDAIAAGNASPRATQLLTHMIEIQKRVSGPAASRLVEEIAGHIRRLAAAGELAIGAPKDRTPQLAAPNGLSTPTSATGVDTVTAATR